MANVASCTPCSARVGSVEYRNGRMYRDVPGSDGTQLESILTSSLIACKPSSSSMRGRPSRSHERFRRATFSQGLNSCTSPSGRRYALSPSKTSVP